MIKKVIAIIITIFFIISGFLFFKAYNFGVIVRGQSGPVFDAKKVILLPGWMESVSHYNIYHGLDIWKENIDPKKKIDSEYVIGHSLGATFALVNWEYNKNTKLILVNPVVPKRNQFIAFGEITQSISVEGFDPGQTVGGGHLITAAGKAFNFLDVDLLKIMKEVPKNDLTVLCGMEDKFFCDQNSVKLMQNSGIDVIEVEGAGHGWDTRFDDEIKKIIK